MVLTIRTHSLNRKKNVLFDVLRYYGQFSTSALVSLSHERSLRGLLRIKMAISTLPYQKESIKAFFESKPPIPEFTIPYQENHFAGYRDKDGYLVLPKEWDDEA